MDIFHNPLLITLREKNYLPFYSNETKMGSPAKPCGFNIFIVYLLASSLGFFVALFSNHTVMNPYIALAKLMLPQEISESFDLVKVEEKNVALEKLLHLYLDEFETPPNHRTDLKPNGFYPETLIGDFPIRDRKVVLHVRRRRWLDPHGESVSTDWSLICKGTRYSKEFAAFLKEFA